MKKYAADLETTTDENDCRVWAWGICEVGNLDNYIEGNNFDDFIDWCEQSENATLYFQNLKFDGEFNMVKLFEKGFKHVIDRIELDSKTFTTLISDKGQFYSMKIIFKKTKKKTNYVEIFDSYKILPFSVDDVAKGFGLPFGKIKQDQEFYSRYRPVGHVITSEESEYLQHDVKIMASALDILFKQDLTKMTQGSNALHDYKQTIGKKSFSQWFPVPDYDQDVRRSYRGGFTYLNPTFKDIDIAEGIVLDVNSLYPSVMHDKPLPYGEGIFFPGQYEHDALYNLYVQMFTCEFELKENYIPTVQIKNTLAFVPTDYLVSSDGEDVTMCMTNVDLELFLEHYEVYNIEYHSGWKFKSTKKLFTEYIDKWSAVKIQSKIDGNKAMYLLAKLMLNALYGKFALNPNIRRKIPYYDKGQIRYTQGEKETRNPIYIPVGTFITSWARHKTITSAQQVYSRFIYADTDSLHLVGAEIPEELEIDDTALGKWKHESTFVRGRYVRQKTYIETNKVSQKEFDKMEDEEKELCYTLNNELVKDNIVCAGLPSSCYKYVTWENFKEGAIYSGKLQPKHVVGGIVLKETTFEIKHKKVVDKTKERSKINDKKT